MSKRHGKVGAGSRLSLAVQVGLAAGLALAGLLLINWLAGRPGIRQRIDLTEKSIYSLDPATKVVLDSLEEPVVVDVFYRPVGNPLTQLAGEVQQRATQLLQLMESESAGRVEIRFNDMGDVPAIEARKSELRLRGIENCFVFSRDKAVEVVRMFGDMALFDIGNPDPNAYKPASISRFDAEAAMVRALLAVTRGDAPKVLFTHGHGELDIYGVEPEVAIGKLQRDLIDDGMEVDRWNPLEVPEIPEDTDVIAVIEPVSPLSDQLIETLVQYQQGGGRLLLAGNADPKLLERSRIIELAERFDITIGKPQVLQVYIDPATRRPQFGYKTQLFSIHPDNMVRHPITEGTMKLRRTFSVFAPHAVTIVSQPSGAGMSTTLFRSLAQYSWEDDGNYILDDQYERPASYDLAAARQDVPQGAEVDEEGARREGRLVVLGSGRAMVDQIHGDSPDFHLAVFNWLTDREWRVTVNPKDPDRRVLPLEGVARVFRFALYVLPGAMLLLGLLFSWLRSRGGPKRKD